MVCSGQKAFMSLISNVKFVSIYLKPDFVTLLNVREFLLCCVKVTL